MTRPTFAVRAPRRLARELAGWALAGAGAGAALWYLGWAVTLLPWRPPAWDGAVAGFGIIAGVSLAAGCRPARQRGAHRGRAL